MKNKGITLVALVITIIILLILAGISIFALTGSGLFENAKLAKEKADIAQEKEDETLTDYKNKIEKYIDASDREEQNSELYYKKGDVINYPSSINVSGFVTESSKYIDFSIPLSKNIASDVTDIEISTAAFQIRRVDGGYLINSEYSENSNIGNYFNVRCFGENFITFRYKKSSAITNATNNTPVSIELVDLVLKFK